jgi:hypothetical protein
MSDRLKAWLDEGAVIGCLSYGMIALCGLAVFVVSAVALFREVFK